jgi:hypothetical protein
MLPPTPKDPATAAKRKAGPKTTGEVEGVDFITPFPNIMVEPLLQCSCPHVGHCIDWGSKSSSTCKLQILVVEWHCCCDRVVVEVLSSFY